jgi:hypothetical protein
VRARWPVTWCHHSRQLPRCEGLRHARQWIEAGRESDFVRRARMGHRAAVLPARTNVLRASITEVVYATVPGPQTMPMTVAARYAVSAQVRTRRRFRPPASHAGAHARAHAGAITSAAHRNRLWTNPWHGILPLRQHVADPSRCPNRNVRRSAGSALGFPVPGAVWSMRIRRNAPRRPWRIARATVARRVVPQPWLHNRNMCRICIAAWCCATYA